MRINKIIIRTGIAAICLLVVSMAGVAVAVKVQDQRPISLREIDRQCKRHLDRDGFGRAMIKAAHLSNEKGQISVPCKLVLKNGATLQLSNVELQSSNLVIQTQTDAQKPSHLIIKKSRLVSATGGMQVQFTSPHSTVDINETKFDYPISLGVAVGSGDDDVIASLRVVKSQFLSTGPASEGIVLVSSGKTTVKDSQFGFADPEGQALLLGSDCQLANNKNANNRCHGP